MNKMIDDAVDSNKTITLHCLLIAIKPGSKHCNLVVQFLNYKYFLTSAHNINN